MQYQKLTKEQKEIRSWRMKRDKLVGKMLAENPSMTRSSALKKVMKELRKKEARRK